MLKLFIIIEIIGKNLINLILIDGWLKVLIPKKYSFIMFGGGLRICPGKKLAMVELLCLIALLFRKYEINLVDMNAPLNIASGSVTVCTELLVEIKPRN